MNYQDIEKVNAEIKGIDLKGKNYAMVAERVTAFRKLFPEGFIKTEIVSHDGQTVVMQSIAGYYDNGVPVILSTGLAQEVKGFGMVNKTSYIENCETSAVGRALGFMSIGENGGGICSAEELTNAIVAQKQMDEVEKMAARSPLPEDGQVVRVSAVPPVSKESPEVKYLANAMKELREARKITAAENKSLFNAQKDALVNAGLAPDKPIQDYSLTELKSLIDAMWRNFSPTGTELKGAGKK